MADFRVTCAEARFSVNFNRLGFHPGFGLTLTLPRLIGVQQASLLFYTGAQFPAKYRNGAFIAFHGSWNRAPEPQAGFNVVFQPLEGGRSGGRYEVFADGFSPNIGAGRASAAGGAHRPTGLAQAPDGSLYVADDAGGRIYRIYFKQ